MPTVTLIRGLPGSGKTTLARAFAAVNCAADDYFDLPTGYFFDARLLPAAHANCQRRVKAALVRGFDVAVHNTFTQEWEVAPYRAIAKAAGADLKIIDLFDAGLSDAELAERNQHSVPAEKIAAMRQRYDHDIS